jgi:plasmid replication initiation protein
MMRKLVNVPLETGGFKMFQLFKEGICTQDEYGDWYVEIDAHDQALPLMFEFKEKYFTYQLWNAMRLKSSNQLRMYEILKQYEHARERVITVVELKELLGIDPEEYPRFGDFKVSVLDVCQKALEEYTDIKYTFEPTGRKGKGGKILQLKFTITKNRSYRPPVTLADLFAGAITDGTNECLYTENGPLINVTNEYDPDNDNNYFNRELYPLFTDALGGEFGREEVKVLYNLAIRINPYGRVDGCFEDYWRRIFNYLKYKHDELRWRASRNDLDPLKNRFSYLKKIIEAELPED